MIFWWVGGGARGNTVGNGFPFPCPKHHFLVLNPPRGKPRMVGGLRGPVQCNCPQYRRNCRGCVINYARLKRQQRAVMAKGRWAAARNWKGVQKVQRFARQAVARAEWIKRRRFIRRDAAKAAWSRNRARNPVSKGYTRRVPIAALAGMSNTQITAAVGRKNPWAKKRQQAKAVRAKANWQRQRNAKWADAMVLD